MTVNDEAGACHRIGVDRFVAFLRTNSFVVTHVHNELPGGPCVGIDVPVERLREEVDRLWRLIKRAGANVETHDIQAHYSPCQDMATVYIDDEASSWMRQFRGCTNLQLVKSGRDDR